MKRNYLVVTILCILAQVLDCADGQMARRYSMGSPLGAWFDHSSDEMFGVGFTIVIGRLIYLHNGEDFLSVPFQYIENATRSYQRNFQTNQCVQIPEMLFQQ